MSSDFAVPTDKFVHTSCACRSRLVASAPESPASFSAFIPCSRIRQAFCAALQPDECAITAELVQRLVSDRSPLRRTGIDYRLDRALWRADQVFQLWLPLIREERAKPMDWAGDLKSSLVSVKAEILQLTS